MENSEILKCARDYISSDLTISEVAEKNGITKKTLQNNFKKLESIDSDLYEIVESKKIDNQIIGRKKGGKNISRTIDFTKEEAIVIANAIIDEQLTYEQAEERFNIPHSTIYEMVHSEFIDSDLKIKLAEVADANHRGLTTEKLEERNKTNGK